MISTRWRKLIRDLTTNKMRTTLVILSMCIGVFGISVVANSYSILLREMDRNYKNTTPSSATLWTDQMTASDVEQIKALPYIKDAEIRDQKIGRVEVGDNEWKDILLFVIQDFNHISLDTFTSEQGSAIPATGEILFERKALAFANATLGQSINIKLPNKTATSLKLTGTVHAPGLAPSWMEGIAYGYITSSTYQLLGGVEERSELKILLAENTMNKEYIHETAYLLKDYLENKGIAVNRIDIPNP